MSVVDSPGCTHGKEGEVFPSVQYTFSPTYTLVYHNITTYPCVLSNILSSTVSYMILVIMYTSLPKWLHGLMNRKAGSWKRGLIWDKTFFKALSFPRDFWDTLNTLFKNLQVYSKDPNNTTAQKYFIVTGVQEDLATDEKRVVRPSSVAKFVDREAIWRKSKAYEHQFVFQNPKLIQ